MSDYGDLASMMSGARRSSPYDRKRQLALQMMQAGADYSPVRHPLQGAARLAQALVGGYMANKADAEEKDAREQLAQKIADAGKIADPQERIAAYTAIDPQIGMRAGAAFAVEQAKLAQQDQIRGQQADGWAGGHGLPPGGQIQQGPLPPPGQGGYQGTLSGLESDNNPTATNPQSGAAGQFQFMPATWAEVRAKNPDLNLPPDPRQAPPELQAEAEKRFRASNAQALQGAGIEPTPANLYLAHRTGAQGAQTLLRADPRAPMSSVVPANWIAQNPDMQGKTVGQFLQLAQQRFGGGPQGQPGQAPPAPPVTVQATPPQGNAQQPGAPLTVNMRGPGGVPQGSADAMPPMRGAPPPPQAPGGMPAVTPPAIPDVPRPPPNPQTVARLKQAIARGLPEAQADAILNQEIDRDWSVARERAKMEYDQRLGETKYQRERDSADVKRGDDQTKQRFEQAGKLRDDFNGLQPVKDYNKASTVFRSAVEASKGDSKASDINMVYAFATMMDPGSVVRDSETGMVYATQGASDRIKGLVAGLQGKSGLGAETKQALLREMGSRYESYKGAYDNITTTFKGIAERSGINADDVIIPVAPIEWKKADEGPAVVKSDAEYDALPSGATFVGPDGKTRRKP